MAIDIFGACSLFLVVLFHLSSKFHCRPENFRSTREFLSLKRGARKLVTNVFAREGSFVEEISETDFVIQCTSYLVSQRVLVDERISNEEYVNFLEEFCDQIETCYHDGVILYEELNENLKISFVRNACVPDNQVPSCYYHFDSDDSEFGYVASPENVSVEERISSLCSSTYSIISEEGIFGGNVVDENPSAPPQSKPMPTQQPTQIPTQQPTKIPTQIPTLLTYPTDAPTIESTSSPSSTVSARVPTPSPTVSRSVPPQPTLVPDLESISNETDISMQPSSDETPVPTPPSTVPLSTPTPVSDAPTSPVYKEEISTSSPSPSSNPTDYSAAPAPPDSEIGALSTAAVLGIIGGGALVCFCAAVIYSGSRGIGSSDYEINKLEEFDPLHLDPTPETDTADMLENVEIG